MRRKIPFIYLILCLILIVTTVSATGHVIDVFYSPMANASESLTIDFSSFLLRIHTDSDLACKYSITSGLHYSEMPGNFDYDSGRNHEKTFNNINDGVYNYYIKCINSSFNNSFEPSELEFDLRINSLISGDIVLLPESPLKAGKVELTLLTSKTVSQTPMLSYSFDGIVYNKVSLFGSENSWRGYFIVPESIGDAVGSFKLIATDLEGRQGDKITKGEVFIADTTKPKPISYINAAGYQGQIKLDWYFDEELKEFKIYRSTSPNADYTDFYKTNGKSPFLDNLVEKGKTYYYRISGVDESGNEGELSREVYATALIDNSSQSFGLDLSLMGKVDNFISDIDSLILDIDNIGTSISSKSEKEKNLFSNLGFAKDADNAKSELNSLKSDVLKYKLQDLTNAELESKLGSSKLKLDIIKKKVPEDIVITLEDSRTENIKKEDVESSILELNSTISEKEKEKNLKDSLKLIQDSGLKIQSSFYVCDIVYLDGTKKEISAVERNINSELEKSETALFYEFIPKELSESASQINIKNSNYRIIKEDPVLSFGLDNKKIFYSFNKASALSSLKDIKIVLISLNEENVKSGAGITGYSIFFDLGNQRYLGIFIGALLSAGLLFYFVYLKKKKLSSDFFDLDKDVDEAFYSIKKGDIKKAEEIYSLLNETYKKLDKKEKHRAYPIIDSLRNKILASKSLHGK